LVSNLSILSQPSSGTDEGYSRNMLCALLVPEGIIRPVVSASALTWFIRCTMFERIGPTFERKQIPD
jgi:hypothetical protein